jgi:hypothetical protein
MPLWCSGIEAPSDPNRNSSPHHRIVRVPPGESVVLNSAERAPYLLILEVLHGDLDFDPERRGNKELLKGMIQKELSTGKAGRTSFPPSQSHPDKQHTPKLDMSPAAEDALQAGPALTLQPPTPMNHMTPLSPNFPTPAQASNIPTDVLRQWRDYAVMLFSGQMGADSSSSLTTLGDYLLANDWVEAAHCW